VIDIAEALLSAAVRRDPKPEYYDMGRLAVHGAADARVRQKVILAQKVVASIVNPS